MPTETTTPIEPFTTNGWYEHSDGTVGRYVASEPGRVHLLETVASWGEVPTAEQAEDKIAADHADYLRATRPRD